MGIVKGQLLRKYLPVVAAVVSGTFGLDHIRVEHSPSKFEVAAAKLGLPQAKQDALLEIYNMAGYFAGDRPWADAYRSKIFPNDAKPVYQTLLKPAIDASLADQANPTTLKTDVLRQNLFGKSAKHFWEYVVEQKISLTEQQILDWVLYLAQNGFARPKGAERIDIKSPGEWLKLYGQELTDAARNLGMIDRIDPSLKEYDECWVPGATRLGVTARLIELKYFISQGIHIKDDKIKVLAGGRLINAEMDGIGPEMLKLLMYAAKAEKSVDELNITVSNSDNDKRTAEGIEYLRYLAKKNNIELVPGAETIKYTKENCPKGCLVGKTYPNYVNPQGPKLTESLMSQDMLETLGFGAIQIVDTQASGHMRPDTTSTAIDAAKAFVNENTSDGNTRHILFVSNQPYTIRQSSDTRAAAEKIFAAQKMQVVIEAAGASCKQGGEIVLSELGALMTGVWKLINTGRDASDLMYQTRDNDSEVPPLGDVDS